MKLMKYWTIIYITS